MVLFCRVGNKFCHSFTELWRHFSRIEFHLNQSNSSTTTKKCVQKIMISVYSVCMCRYWWKNLVFFSKIHLKIFVIFGRCLKLSLSRDERCTFIRWNCSNVITQHAILMTRKLLHSLTKSKISKMLTMLVPFAHLIFELIDFSIRIKLIRFYFHIKPIESARRWNSTVKKKKKNENTKSLW